MKVRLITDLTIENRNLASGEVTEISEMSGKLLIKKGQAIEYHEPGGTREKAVIQNDPVNKHNLSSSNGKPQHGKRKSASKGRTLKR